MNLLIRFIVLVCIIVVAVIVLKDFQLEQTELMNLTAENCCNGGFCTNTLYNVDTGECEYFSNTAIGFKFTKEVVITFFVLMVVAFFIGLVLSRLYPFNGITK